MSWAVDLVGSDVYVATDTAMVASSTTIASLLSSGDATQMTLAIYAGDPVIELELDAKAIGSDVVSATRIATERYTFAVMPYTWTDAAYMQLLRLLRKPYHYVRSSVARYPNWRHIDDAYYACEVVKLDVEHKHESGRKYVTITIALTLR